MNHARRVQCGKPECYRLWHSQRVKEWQRGYYERTGKHYRNNYRPTYERVCVECGADFCSLKREAKYCSTGAGSCEARARSRDYLARDIGRERREAAEERRGAELLASITATPSKRDVSRYRWALRFDVCAYCGERPSGGIDHIDHKAGTGSNDWTNLTGCCKRCNELKATLPLLVALPWIPISREYHRQRRLLFAATR